MDFVYRRSFVIIWKNENIGGQSLIILGAGARVG